MTNIIAQPIATEAPVNKSAVLAEVEADANYITNRRFREHYELQAHEQSKKASKEIESK